MLLALLSSGLRNGDAHPLQHRKQSLRRKDRLLTVPGAAQPHHQPVADQLVIANPFDGGHVLDARQLSRGLGLA